MTLAGSVVYDSGLRMKTKTPRRGSLLSRGGHVQLGQLQAEHGALGVDVDRPGVRLGRVVVQIRHAGVAADEQGLVHDAGVDDEVVECNGQGMFRGSARSGWRP